MSAQISDSLSGVAPAIEEMLMQVTAGRDTLPVGRALGGYVIHRVLGRDDIAIAYRATEPVTKRQVEIEEYLPEAIARREDDGTVQPRSAALAAAFEAGRRAFVEEAKQLEHALHPTLLRVLASWQSGGTAYRVIAPRPERTLDTLRASFAGVPQEDWLRALLLPLAGALGALHAVSLVHGNVRPGNIVVRDDGTPLLLGFDSARWALADLATTHPEPGFLAIEQTERYGALPAGPWTDLYALGALALYCVTGRPPLDAGHRLGAPTVQPFAQAVTEQRWIEPSLAFAPPLVAAIDHALMIAPGQRPRSIDDFVPALGDPAAVQTRLDVPPPVPTRLPGAAPPPALPSAQMSAPAGRSGQPRVEPVMNTFAALPATGLPAQRAPAGLTSAEEAALVASFAAATTVASPMPPSMRPRAALPNTPAPPRPAAAAPGTAAAAAPAAAAPPKPAAALPAAAAPAFAGWAAPAGDAGAVEIDLPLPLPAAPGGVPAIHMPLVEPTDDSWRSVRPGEPAPGASRRAGLPRSWWLALALPIFGIVGLGWYWGQWQQDEAVLAGVRGALGGAAVPAAEAPAAPPPTAVAAAPSPARIEPATPRVEPPPAAAATPPPAVLPPLTATPPQPSALPQPTAAVQQPLPAAVDTTAVAPSAAVAAATAATPPSTQAAPVQGAPVQAAPAQPPVQSAPVQPAPVQLAPVQPAAAPPPTAVAAAPPPTSTERSPSRPASEVRPATPAPPVAAARTPARRTAERTPPVARTAPAARPAGRPAEPDVRTAAAVRPPAPVEAAPEPDNPRAACSPRTNFALYRCMQTQCERDRFYAHGQCVRLRLYDEVS